MERAGAEAGDQHDCHEIEHTIKEPTRPEFTHAVLTGAVLHDHLDDLKTSSRREDRHEAV